MIERKIPASHLEEEMNIEFGISVVSKFLVPRSGPAQGGYSGLQVTGMIEGFFWV